MRQVFAVVVALGVVVSASPRAQVVGQSWDATFRVLPKPDDIEATMKRLSARPHHVGSAYDKDNARVAARAVQGVRLGRADRDVRRAVPDAAASGCSRCVAPRGSRPSSRSRRCGGSDLEPEDRAAAHLQRVLDRRRRHGAARVRQLRPAGGLRRARAARRLGARAPSSSRATAQSWRGIKPKVAARARRHRLPHLLRSARRRVLRRARCFRTARCGRTDGVQRGSVMDMPVYPGDPLTPGRRRDGRREAAAPSRTRRR